MRPAGAQRRPRHRLEAILSRRSTRWLLGLATAPGRGGRSWFERLCASFDNPGLSRWTRWKWALAHRLIDFTIRRKRLDRELLKRKLFHHRPTVKALNLTGRSIAHYGLTEPQRYVAPLFVVWNITQLCNLSCVHCYQDAGAKRPEGELTLREKLAAVDQMADCGVPFLAIAGGEPLATKDLWPTLEHAHRRGIHLTLATNGTLLTPQNVARLRECGVKYVEVSMDSVRAEDHDGFRQQKGAWARAVEGIRNSVAGGIRTGLAACLTNRTVHQVDDMVEFALELGCQTFSHFNFIPVGRGREILELDLTPRQREYLLRRLNHHLQENRINVISTAPQFGRACVIYADTDGLFATGHAGRARGPSAQVLSRYVGGCGAGRCYCAIQPNGIVTPCVYISSVPVGDLRIQTLLEIWNHDLFAVLSDRDQRGCHCPVCDYRSYCGGCRARALAYTGDITAGDPGCIHNQRVWDDLADEARRSLPVLG